jgi:hypothetical protein
MCVYAVFAHAEPSSKKESNKIKSVLSFCVSLVFLLERSSPIILYLSDDDDDYLNNFHYIISLWQLSFLADIPAVGFFNLVEFHCLHTPTTELLLLLAFSFVNGQLPSLFVHEQDRYHARERESLNEI